MSHHYFPVLTRGKGGTGGGYRKGGQYSDREERLFARMWSISSSRESAATRNDIDQIHDILSQAQQRPRQSRSHLDRVAKGGLAY